MSEGRQYRERLQYQLKFLVNKKQFKTKAAAEAATVDARRHFLITGEESPGVRIVARWRNPDNRNPLHAEWKTTEDDGQSLYEFWTTLGRGRGALR